MSALPHISVLADEVIHYLDPQPGGRYIDGTLGAGGHTRRILEASGPDSEVLGIDRDQRAHAIAKTRLTDLWSRVHPVHGNFGDVASIAREHGWDQVNGVVVDLGVSSIQLDLAERGFSFSKSGPIDMRMDETQEETAFDLIRRSTPHELIAILRNFGEERFASRIANVIKDAVKGGVTTTTELAEVIADCIPGKARRHMRIHPATKTFQALRIAVNSELDELTHFLADFPDVLAPGGRCVVISFHSLEDRMVKRRFRDLAWTSSLPPALAVEAGERVDPVVVVLTRKAVRATDEEVAANPRARSAVLRACEKFTGEVRESS